MFQTTNWAIIESLKTNPDEAMASIARTYWAPLYTFIIGERRCSPDDARDFVQGFFLECLEREVLRKADAGKGKFRTFLLTCFKHYVNSLGRRERALKRAPRSKLESLQALMDSYSGSLELKSGELPDRAYERVWREGVLRETLKEYQEQCRRLNLEIRFDLFRRRIVDPLLDGTPAPTLASLAGEFNLSTPTSVHRAVNTARSEFLLLAEKNLRRWVGTEAEAREDTRVVLSGIRPADATEETTFV